MTLASYSELSSAIIDFMDDANLSSSVDTFIAMAEARFSRVLDTPDMEVTTTLAGSSTTIDLPADFYEVRGLFLNGQYTLPLSPVSLDVLKDRYPDNRSGVPQVYAVDGSGIVLGPLPSASSTLTLKYKQKVPALTSINTTNWLLTKHPDLYLIACMVAAELRGWNDARLPVLKAAADEMIAEINAAGLSARFMAGPLVMRPVVTDSGRFSGGNTGNLLTDGTDFLVDG